MPQPDYNALLGECWGYGPDACSVLLSVIASASNVAIGANPPYAISDFLSSFPQFSGTPINVAGTLTSGSDVVSNLSSVAGLAAGQLVSAPGIPSGALILSLTPGPIQVTSTTENGNLNIVVSDSTGVVTGAPVSGAGIQAGSVVLNIAGTTLTLSQAATADGVNVALQIGANPSIAISQNATTSGLATLQVFTKPLIPAMILQTYINLATASIQQVRWCEMWYLAMDLYIAHYCTLFLQAYAQGPGSTASQVAAAGFAIGIKISKSAGDVSVGISVLQGLEDWGSYQLTIYGQQFATFAKSIGSGGMLLL